MAPHFDDPPLNNKCSARGQAGEHYNKSINCRAKSQEEEVISHKRFSFPPKSSKLNRKHIVTEDEATPVENLPNPALGTDTALAHYRSASSQPRRDSKICDDNKEKPPACDSHQRYLDSLVPPTAGEAARIDEIQQHKAEEVIKRRLSMDAPELSEGERAKAAGLIQRNYRGYRERRQMNGMGLDPSSRWVEAVKEARYRNLTQPRSRADSAVLTNGTETGQSPSQAMRNWKKIGTIARRAAGDEDSEDLSDDNEDMTEAEREELRLKRHHQRLERQKAAKIMDLQYWLESTDLKHRYGSNLRTYHEQWLKADTQENFFYWLDYGEGRNVEAAGCSREQLDRECVRYLSREERLNYLVKIDKDGRLCWAKNGARIDTTIHYKDSIHGIVPENDETPPYSRPDGEAATGLQRHSTSSSSSPSEGEEDSTHPHHHEHTSDRAGKYATPGLDNAKGVKKAKHVSAATVFNKLLRSSVKKNTWIYVADVNFRLYVGIKQSGAFQHSSFLHGSRISSAGLIKIKDGRLDKLSPLSGHYRPPTSSFRAFVHSLKEAGCDMSHVSISRSYAVLVGLEAYVKSRRRGKRLVKKLIHGRDKLLDPEEVKRQEEEARDKSESAALERRFLELQQETEEEKANVKLMQKLHLHKGPIGRKSVDTEVEGVPKESEVQVPGTGAESGIAPEGKRNTEKTQRTA